MHGRLLGWRRDAFQSAPKLRGSKADLRIVYRMLPDGQLELFGFGHRHQPESVYRRLSARPVP